MEQDYGDRVRVEFHDIGRPDARQRYPDVLDAVEERRLPLPVTAVNDTLRFAGGVAYYAIQKAVQELLDADENGTKDEKEQTI